MAEKKMIKSKVPLGPLPPDPKGLRVPGKGLDRFKPQRDFDAPLPDEVIRAFETCVGGFIRLFAAAQPIR